MILMLLEASKNIKYSELFSENKKLSKLNFYRADHSKNSPSNKDDNSSVSGVFSKSVQSNMISPSLTENVYKNKTKANSKTNLINYILGAHHSQFSNNKKNTNHNYSLNHINSKSPTMKSVEIKNNKMKPIFTFQDAELMVNSENSISNYITEGKGNHHNNNHSVICYNHNNIGNAIRTVQIEKTKLNAMSITKSLYNSLKSESFINGTSNKNKTNVSFLKSNVHKSSFSKVYSTKDKGISLKTKDLNINTTSNDIPSTPMTKKNGTSFKKIQPIKTLDMTRSKSANVFKKK
jgi:hypothetical protein